MKEEMMSNKRTACLAYHGLSYYGVSAPAPHIIEAIARHSQATIGDVVEISDEALSKGIVPSGLATYSFIILMFPRGAQDAVKQDCVNYVQRTVRKTVVGAVWLEVERGGMQHIWGLHGSLSSNDLWLSDWPVPQSDGVHFTVELKRREPEASWELMESSWESPNQFEDEGEAEEVAHNLALRYDGDMDTRVISPNGVVLVTFRLQNYLAIRRRGLQEERKALSPYAPLPMLHEVRAGYQARKQMS
jgi:hypothetical protein